MKVSFILVILFSLFFLGCQKEVLESEKNWYLHSVRVLNVPSTNWDSFSAPDLRIDLARSASSVWSFSTNTASNNTTVPATLSFSGEVLLTDENWDMRLVDEDDLDPDDVIYNISQFNPKNTGRNGKVELSSNGQTVMELLYDAR